MEANCLTTLAAARVFHGQAAAGVEAARQAGALCEGLGNTWGQAQSAVHLALGLLECGAYGEALAVAQRAVAAARELTFPPLRCGSLWGLGTVYAALQDPERARAVHLEALAVAKAMGWHQNLEMCLSALSLDHALLQHWEQAHAYAVEALAARDYAWLTPLAAWRWVETQALAQGGDGERAGEDLRRFAVQIGANRRYRVAYLHAQAVLARRGGDVARAAAYLHEAGALAEALGLPGDSWRTQAALGSLLRQSGDEQGAARSFERATAIREQLAAGIDDEGLRAALLAATPLGGLVAAGVGAWPGVPCGSGR
jgi:tetratricopeptide (TPR) repeat protein